MRTLGAAQRVNIPVRWVHKAHETIPALWALRSSHLESLISDCCCFGEHPVTLQVPVIAEKGHFVRTLSGTLQQTGPNMATNVVFSAYHMLRVKERG
ncbi:hypothetical protein L596_003293 [Steinernema carpocapsae]|uniref:Uncharacterized protein n=1 Tax=Steinernema carpocapsae TaxID=34508 RepID=A0A4U8UTP4_STECR|nr:hypothetical protein L596_003293 [Steinernema carpocapsae]